MLKKLRESISLGKGRLESKTGLLDMKDPDKPRKPALSPTQTTRFRSFLEARRISSRPISIIRATDSDILHFKEDTYDPEKYEKDELLSIPILPADEMDTLTSEIKVWKRNRRTFLIFFFLIQFLSLVTLTIGLLFTFLWYKGDAPGSPGSYGRPGSDEYNIHMCLQLINVWLFTVVVLLFRVAPNTTTKNIIIIHGVLSVLGTIAFTVGIVYAIQYHSMYLQRTLDYHSFHSWIGMIAAFTMLVALVTGALIACCPTRFVRFLHAPAGTATLILCGAGAITGFFERALIQLGGDYKKRAPSAIVVNLFGLAILFQFILVRISLSDFTFRRRPKPQWDVIVHRNMEAIEEAFFDVHNMYENFETWIKQINSTRLRALRVPRMSICSATSR